LTSEAVISAIFGLFLNDRSYQFTKKSTTGRGGRVRLSAQAN
jgi:hypothetical protein